MGERELISTLMYGTISLLVAYSWIFFYVSEASRVRQGMSTGLEALTKVFITHIAIVFVFIVLFSILDIFLPPGFKISGNLINFWEGAGDPNGRIFDPWVEHMKNFNPDTGAGEGASLPSAEKFTVSWVINYILVGKYIIDLLFMGGSLLFIVLWYMKELKDHTSMESPLSKLFKAVLIYVSLMTLMFIHMRIGSAAIQAFVGNIIANFDLWSDMQKHVTYIFKI